MSIYLSGVTFADQHVTPSDDGAIYAEMLSDGIANGCGMTSVGSTLTLAAGRLICKGRVIRVPCSQSIAVSNPDSKNYARLVLTVDLSESTSPFHQAALDVEYANSIAAFSALTQNDINAGGTRYQMVLCIMQMTGSNISAIKWKCGAAHGKGVPKTVTLSSGSGWDANNKVKLDVDGVTASTNVVCTYAYGSKEAYQAADIDVSDQGDGWLEFHASYPPAAPGEGETEVPITVNLLLL